MSCAHPLCAGDQEVRPAQSSSTPLTTLSPSTSLGIVSLSNGLSKDLSKGILDQVETAARKARTLEELGKETLGQSAEILDLGEASQKALLGTLKNRKKDWKLRYWAADILGYVGNGSAVGPLLSAAGDSRHDRRVRLRSCDSLAEIAFRKKTDPQKLRARLGKMLKKEKDKAVKKKIRETLKKLEGERNKAL